MNPHLHNLTQLNQLQQVVAIGGGHGLGRLMSSLGFLKERLTGIVTTTDNGGSTGRIRLQHGGIAWGDLRNCINQIITEPSTASALFEYRFSGNGDLAGHNLGNLMLKALEDMKIRPLEGVNLIRTLLRVRCHLIPMSETPVHLGAKLHSGATVVGEVNIDKLTELPKRLFLIPQVSATPEAVSALQQAELILLGPGSFLTSIMPPLLLPEIAQALQSTAAKIMFIDNLGVEHSPAATLSLAQRIDWIEKTIGQKLNNKSAVDGIITYPEAHYQDLLHKTIVAEKLNDDDIIYRHNRTLLCKSIDKLLAKLQ
ncbi:uridine diphosphate-N-acetylglucosamine-binding protein YvcK [Testudinibacter sp. TR-2022]|uniref:gluconeogenesis factor YvcK family protein n=1 Tax=Testudinibacter sp. TR-2022 TaxID=2585029 RepID=UPI001118616A|nr:uridine diphosphate-N-acetylglucosamine-binding protein YvcK [Testudinibacter sp. TR-2022]TNH04472.1 uridine diphosphate-N-acetylglucosamine-binding protein YvcK [Pasteurellaceae bacterium Phil31]TNH12006.1 uridine diphosphate-N-acetylglucosamine-binding protein YvcK [Testudinibacter sp. TR-2022]TNH12689.1 uridine diphosphate-N-acetylglucosamine-binding protein YvcK [Testudinibacter sp. TR-2022]TNH12794.1 uridine diphosphate-N-acetylglucosamine-binding protein YvcK [Testudinibacter sp. TR-20